MVKIPDNLYIDFAKIVGGWLGSWNLVPNPDGEGIGVDHNGTVTPLFSRQEVEDNILTALEPRLQQIKETGTWQ